MKMFIFCIFLALQCQGIRTECQDNTEALIAKYFGSIKEDINQLTDELRNVKAQSNVIVDKLVGMLVKSEMKEQTQQYTQKQLKLVEHKMTNLMNTFHGSNNCEAGLVQHEEVVEKLDGIAELINQTTHKDECNTEPTPPEPAHQQPSCTDIFECDYAMGKSGQCLVVIHDRLSWQEAKESCKAQNASLVSLADPKAFHQYMARNYGDMNKRFWLGGSDNDSEGNWKWINGEIFGEQFPWPSKEPNNSPTYGSENCLQWGLNINFNDANCKLKFGYVCGRDCDGGVIVAGQCLLFSNDSLSWQEAKESCEAQNATLVSLTDPTAFHRYMARNYGEISSNGFWLGASDIQSEGEWTWINGEALGDEFPWPGAEPNGARNQNCLHWGWKANFDDNSCNELRRYVCKLAMH